MTLAAPWPLPDRAGRRRVSNVTGVVAMRSVPERLRRIRSGHAELVTATAFGAAPWCPRHPGWGQLVLSADGVAYDQGLPRPVPVERLSPLEVRPARRVSAPLSLPRGAWVLDLGGLGGPASIVVREKADLAVLGGLAGWPVPPGWTDVTSG